MKRTVSVLLALLMALSLCACGSKDKDKGGDTAASAAPAAAAAEQNESAAKAEAPAPADTPVGVYKLTELTENGEPQDLSELAQYGMLYYLTLEADGTGSLEMLGEKEKLSWTDAVITVEDGEPAAYSYSDGVLRVMEGNDNMVFTRLTDDELAHYKENGSGSLEDLFGGLTLPEGVTSEISGPVGDYTVSFVGAEAATDNDGNPAIRYWYDFTNNSDKIVTAMSELYSSAEQDGVDVDMAYLFDDVPESSYEWLGVAPGRTIRCTGLYKYAPEGGAVELSIGDFSDKVIYTVDPKALPGAPADEFAFRADADMGYMQSLPETSESVEILGVEPGKDWDDNDLIVVKFRYTNNTDHETSFYSAYTTFVMQDGFALEQSFVYNGPDEQDNMAREIDPGVSIECACGYLLRTDSPVAVVLRQFMGEEYFGKTFDLPQ